MARNKQNEKQKKDGKHRKESKEERKDRIQSQQDAREACEKLIPYSLGFVVILMIIFGAYVQSVPPREVVVPPIVPDATTASSPADPMAKQSFGEASMKDAKTVPPAPEDSETVEL